MYISKHIRSKEKNKTHLGLTPTRTNIEVFRSFSNHKKRRLFADLKTIDSPRLSFPPHACLLKGDKSIPPLEKALAQWKSPLCPSQSWDLISFQTAKGEESLPGFNGKLQGESFWVETTSRKKNRKMDLTWMDFPMRFFLYIYGDPCMVDCFMGKVGMVNSTISHGNPLIPTVDSAWSTPLEKHKICETWNLNFPISKSTPLWETELIFSENLEGVYILGMAPSQ